MERLVLCLFEGLLNIERDLTPAVDHVMDEYGI